jgi:hypothetical protein
LRSSMGSTHQRHSIFFHSRFTSASTWTSPSAPTSWRTCTRTHGR